MAGGGGGGYTGGGGGGDSAFGGGGAGGGGSGYVAAIGLVSGSASAAQGVLVLKHRRSGDHPDQRGAEHHLARRARRPSGPLRSLTTAAPTGRLTAR